jgi:hypothetical protein
MLEEMKRRDPGRLEILVTLAVVHDSGQFGGMQGADEE